MKKRTDRTRTGNRGITAIAAYCNEHGLIFQAEPREDFGIDCYIELEQDGLPQNFIIGIQVKAGSSYKRQITKEGFSVYVSEEDVVYWLAANYPVFFVYYDIDDNLLYFKHVQAELQRYSNISDCKKFSFSESDIATGGALAVCARLLSSKTPNLLNRLEITRVPYPELRIGNQVQAISPSTAQSSGTLDIGHYTSGAPDYPPEKFPRFTTVIGHSSDARWICIFEVEDLGSSGGCNADITFLGTLEWVTLSLPLFNFFEWEHAEHGKNNKYDYLGLAKRVNKINELIREFGVVPAKQIYKDHILYPSNDEGRPRIAIAYGSEKFTIELKKNNGRDALVLSNQAYWPPRSTSLITERIIPIKLSEGSGSIINDLGLRVRRFDFIAEVILSNDAEWITFGIMTNVDHDCWGTPKVHLVHIQVDELKELCRRALTV